MNNIPQSTTLSNATAGTSCFDANHIDVTTIEDLEQVGSDKWTRYPGCIGAFIAEMDSAFCERHYEVLLSLVDSFCLLYSTEKTFDQWKH